MVHVADVMPAKRNGDIATYTYFFNLNSSHKG